MPASTASWTRPRIRDPTYRPVAAPNNDHPRRVSMRVSRWRFGRHGHAVEHRREHVGRAHAAHHRLRREHQPVLEHRRRERLDVVGHDVRAADARGQRARGALQRERAARAHAEHEIAVVAGRLDEVDDVALQLGRDVDLRELLRPHRDRLARRSPARARRRSISPSPYASRIASSASRSG